MMTCAEQASILLEGLDLKLLKQNDVVLWANTRLNEDTLTPAWVSGLAKAENMDEAGAETVLRKHAADNLPVARKIQLIALACDFGFIPLATAIGHLFRVTIQERTTQELSPLEERLVEIVVEWNCQKDLRVLEPALRDKFMGLFSEVLEDSRDVALTLPWLFPLPEEEGAPDQDGAPAHS